MGSHENIIINYAAKAGVQMSNILLHMSCIRGWK